MSTRTEIVSSFYNQVDEDSRLQRSRHGQLEYAVTMHYIHRFIKPGDKVLEVGAGTGRYSIALAKEGMNVTAVELVAHNLKILRSKLDGTEPIEALQGNWNEGLFFCGSNVWRVDKIQSVREIFADLFGKDAVAAH